MALLSGPNRASSSSIRPPAYGSMVDPSPWVPPTLAPKSDVVPIPGPTPFPATVPPLTHAPEVYPSVAPLSVTLPMTFPPPPMTVPIIDPAILALPPMLVSTTSTHALAPIAEPFPFPAPQPQISLSHRTPSILNIPYYNPGGKAVAAPKAPPTYILPATEIEHERRMKQMEEMMKALQESDSRYDRSYLDLNLFPNMKLPPKIKIPDFNNNNTQLNRFTTRLLLPTYLFKPRSLLGSNIPRPFKCNQADPQLRELLSRSNKPQHRQPSTSRIFRQLLAAGKINLVDPNENFNPTNQDQSLRCEYHMGAPGHTTDNCYTLGGKLQALIDKKLLLFNGVKPPNVQINPLPDHGSSSGSTINMIGAYSLKKDEIKEE
ncbi:hypothetical protein CRG98_005373 [Punica granatum]|uniref:Uncharacterized protein n=1 Tax=Punica granatum TaxID=22663 RepID=A0A2I0L0M6_PUNGR|nr:hypothetical protein CRG98_005373 [Punica granatum]